MMQHAEEAAHPLTLSITDLSVWCYGCEAYIDNAVSFFSFRIQFFVLKSLFLNVNLR